MQAAIGVFDSGVGGLTVLKSLRHAFPEQEFIYLGDTARLPYGTKSPETIRQYTLQNIRLLAGRQVQAVVVACNSASTQIEEHEWEGLPIYNVIDPGVETAWSASTNKRIGLLGTRATVESEVYQERLLAKARSEGRTVEVLAQACPLFVPLAEEGWTDDPITNLIVYRYLHSLLGQGIDTLIMGCTHYPILRASIGKAAGSAVQLVDSGEALARQLAVDFTSGRLRKSDRAGLHVMMTDLSSHVHAWSEKLLQVEGRLQIEKV